jgi:hypothetical protein
MINVGMFVLRPRSGGVSRAGSVFHRLVGRFLCGQVSERYGTRLPWI